MRRSSSTATTVWGGASSGHPAKCLGSRVARRTKRALRSTPTGASRATSSARAIDARGSRRRHSEGAVELIAALGGGRVEGYPEDADSVPAGFLFNGALSTYEELGFVRDRKIGKHRWVVAKTVEPLKRRS
jgi:hypothetical protein